MALIQLVSSLDHTVWLNLAPLSEAYLAHIKEELIALSTEQFVKGSKATRFLKATLLPLSEPHYCSQNDWAMADLWTLGMVLLALWLLVILHHLRSVWLPKLCPALWNYMQAHNESEQQRITRAKRRRAAVPTVCSGQNGQSVATDCKQQEDVSACSKDTGSAMMVINWLQQRIGDLLYCSAVVDCDNWMNSHDVGSASIREWPSFFPAAYRWAAAAKTKPNKAPEFFRRKLILAGNRT